MRCRVCGKEFHQAIEGEIHEWNCEYEHRKSKMGKIYIGVYVDDLKEFTTDISANCIEGFFVSTKEACDFIERYFWYDEQFSPWAFLDKEPGFHYRYDGWYNLDNLVNELLELKQNMSHQIAENERLSSAKKIF